MEQKTKIVKEFDTVKTFREIKDKISNDIKGMTFEQLQKYLDNTQLKPKTTKKAERTTRGFVQVGLDGLSLFICTTI